MMNRRVFVQALSAAMLGSSRLCRAQAHFADRPYGSHVDPFGGPSPGPPPPINPMVDPQYVEAAIRDIAGLGFYGIELFGNQIEAMEAHGGVGALLEKYNLPLISAYCGTNLSDPARRKDAIAKTLGLGRAREEVQRKSHRGRAERRPAQHLRFQGSQGRYRDYAQRTRKGGDGHGADAGAPPAHRHLRGIAR